jgi:hypothetical protein
MGEAPVELEDAARLGAALVHAGHHVERDVPALRLELGAQQLVAREPPPSRSHADVGHTKVERPADQAKRCGHDAAVYSSKS